MNTARPYAPARPAAIFGSASAVLGATFVIHALTASAPYGIPALLPFVRRDLGAGYFGAGLVSSAFLFGIVIGAPLAGSGADAYGIRRALVAGIALSTLTLALVPATPNLIVVCMLLAFAGIGYSVLTPGTNKSMLAWFSQKRRATAVGIKQTGVSVGGIAAASFVPAVSLGWGWQASFLVVALLYAAALILSALTALDGAGPTKGVALSPPPAPALRGVLADPAMVLLSVDGFLRVGVQYAFLTYLIAYAIDHLQAPVAWSAAIYAVAHVFGAVGRVGWGWLSDRVFGGRRRGPYAAIALAAACGFLLLGYVAPLDTGVLIAAVALLGLSAAGFQGVGLSLLAEVGGARAGAASGVVNSLAFLGAALMVPAFGQLLDTGASFATLFAILAALSLLTAMITMAIPDVRNQPEHAVD